MIPNSVERRSDLRDGSKSDPNEITSTSGSTGGTDQASTVSRTRLVSVSSGTQYEFGSWVTNSSGTGTVYFNETYVCYGS